MNTPQSDAPIANKEELRQYKDAYGNPCDLLRLVKNEPGWAVNQIRHRDKLDSELAAANERVKKLEYALEFGVGSNRAKELMRIDHIGEPNKMIKKKKEVPCPDCYGGHFKPCNICGDSGVALIQVDVKESTP